MIALIAGIILLAAPFLLVGLFQDWKKGFVYVLFFSILFHTFLAIITQFFGIFYYLVILTATLLADIAVIVYWAGKKPDLKKNKIDWLLLAVVAISFLALWQVHYRYTGGISLALDQTPGYHQVKNMQYVYPYYSDEWYAVSFIKYCISSHHLPFENPLNGKFFINLEMFFHSLLAEVFLILGLNPLTQYALVSIFFNVLIIILAYLFLRICGVSKISSAIASLSILYITCGSSLPGLWHLLPVTLGIIFYLCGFCFLESGNAKSAVLALLAVTLFYPPFFIFSGLGFLIFLLTQIKEKQEQGMGIPKKKSYFAPSIILAIVAVFGVYTAFSLPNFVSFIASKLFYVSFSGPFLMQYGFYDIIPIPTILLAIAGFYHVFEKRKYLFSQLVLGAILWVVYYSTIYRIIIEFERAALLTAIACSIVAGFGLAEIEKYAGLKFKNSKFPVFKCAGICAIILFLLYTPFYTQRDNWKKLTPTDPLTGQMLLPKAPANNYLTQDDLRLFNGITDKKFFSLPWKGTVIGVATGNFPSTTKEGTVSVGSTSDYYSFANSGCDIKKAVMDKYKPDYVYVPAFNCSGFEEVGSSPEGLILYKVTKDKL